MMMYFFFLSTFSFDVQIKLESNQIKITFDKSPFGHWTLQEPAHAGDPSVQHQHESRPFVSRFLSAMASPCVRCMHGTPYLYSRERLTLTAHLYS